MKALIFHGTQRSRFTLERRGDKVLAMKLRPGRNTELTLERDLVATPQLKAMIHGRIIEAFSKTSHFNRLLLAGLLTVEADRPGRTQPKPADAPRTPLRDDEELDRVIAGGTKPVPGETLPPGGDGDDDLEEEVDHDSPLPWGKSMNRGELAAAYVSRGEDPGDMTRAQLIEALTAWDATNDSGEDESADGRSAS